MASKQAPINSRPLDANGFFTSPWTQWFSQTVYTSINAIVPSNTLPLMSSTLGAIGTSLAYAREDHKHPSDTSRVPITRNVGTMAPLTGGGDLSSNLTLSIPAASSSVDGYLTKTDWATFNGKQAALGFTPINKAGDTGIGDMDLGSGKVFKVNGVQVVSAQGAVVANATGGAVVDVEARAAINALLARVRAHGLIAT